MIQNIDGIKAAVVSIGSAIIGTVLNVDTTEISKQMITASADPAWFCTIKPILQTLAWTTAILAGLITAYKGLKRNKKKGIK